MQKIRRTFGLTIEKFNILHVFLQPFNLKLYILYFLLGTECDLKHQMCKRKDSKLMLPWLLIPTKSSLNAFQLSESNNNGKVYSKLTFSLSI